MLPDVTFYLPDLVIGFAGSFHCIGMCGPLAIAMPWYSGEGYALKVLRYHLAEH
jgi:sulfite exporter TauE/SafE